MNEYRVWIISKKYHLVALGKNRTFCGLSRLGQQLPVANWNKLAELLHCQKCEKILETVEVSPLIETVPVNASIPNRHVRSQLREMKASIIAQAPYKIASNAIPNRWDLKFPIATCPTCGSRHVQKWGIRYWKAGIAVQCLKCRDCGHGWSLSPNASYPSMRTNPIAIRIALGLRSKGMSLRRIQAHLNQMEHTKVSHVVIFKWIHNQEVVARCQ